VQLGDGKARYGCVCGGVEGLRGLENAVGYLLLAAGLLLALGPQPARGLRRVGVWLRLGLRRYKRGKLQRSLPALSLLFLVALGISVVSIAVWGFLGEKGGALGSAGDFFGGILNPLIAAAALFALLHTIRIQQEELRLTRHELARSSEALQGQARLYERQLFNQVFAEALADLDAARRELTQRTPGENAPLVGQAAFGMVQRGITNELRNYSRPEGVQKDIKQIDEISRLVTKSVHPAVDPDRFIKTLIHACRLADRSPSPSPPRDSFQRISMRLSENEIFCAFFLALSPDGAPIFEYVGKLDIPNLLPGYPRIPSQFGDPIDLLRLVHSLPASNPNADASNS
jgi:hypothetical protein